MSAILNQLARHATERPDAIAYTQQTQSLTWQQLTEAVATQAANYQAAAFAPAIIYQGGNDFDLVIHLLAAWQAGRAILPLSDRVPDAEVQRRKHVLKNKSFDGPAVLLPSSGTTGLPKLVHRPLDRLDRVAKMCSEAIGITENDHIHAAVPLTHSYGLEHGLLMPVFSGARVILENEFDPLTIGARLAESKATVLPAVPVLIEMLVRIHQQPLPDLRLAYSAGGSLPEELWHAAAQQLQLKVGQLYGTTEVGSVCYADGTSAGFEPNSIGAPMNGVEVKLVDDQVAIRTASAMLTYIGVNKPSFDAHGFFHSGDLATPIGNSHRIHGRNKLMINIGGSKVNPLEVEAVLDAHPSVSRSAVIGLQASDTIARLRAYVELADGTTLNSAALKAYCKEQLSPHKVPRQFVAIERMPVSPTGKILRSELEQ